MKTYLTPIQAIRKNCLECSGQSVKEVRDCVIKTCTLFDFRLGKNPRRQGINRKKEVVLKNTDLSQRILEQKAK
jgi:hypothetical protein